MGRPRAEGERRAPAPPQRIRSALKTPPLARSLAPSRSRELRIRTMGPHEYFVGFHHKISLGNSGNTRGEVCQATGDATFRTLSVLSPGNNRGHVGLEYVTTRQNLQSSLSLSVCRLGSCSFGLESILL